MRMKRIVLVLLSLVMALSCVIAVPFSATAAEVDVASGANEALTGYKADRVQTKDTTDAVTMTAYCSNKDVSSYNTTETKTITIASGAELKMLADRVNEGDAFFNKTIVFIADINMDGITMDSIGATNRMGTVTQPFYEGYAHTCLYNTLVYGQGHTISNLTLSGSAASFGLFGLIGGQIYDLRMDDTCTVTCTGGLTSDGAFGALVGRLDNANWYGTVENCYVAATVSYTGNTAQYEPVGGIVGNTSANCQYITNCTFAGKVSSAASDPVGGILGAPIRENVWVTNCVNKGEVTYTGASNYASVGGIIGGLTLRVKGTSLVSADQNVYVDNCINYGMLTSTKAVKTWVGGIVGAVYGNAIVLEEQNASTVWSIHITNCTGASTMIPNYNDQDADTIAQISSMLNSFYALTDATTGDTGVTGVAMGERLVINESNNKVHYGYAAGRVIKKDNYDDCFEITASTTAAQAAAATQGKFVIKTADAFLHFASVLSNDATAKFTEDETIYLGADMDMAGKTWTPICKGDWKCFSTFDGQGYTISNLINVSSGNYNVALFGKYYSIIKNVVLDNTCFFKNTRGPAAGIVADTCKACNNDPTIINCFNGATVMSTGGTVAGIACGDQCDIYACTNAGLITDESSNGITDIAGIYGGFRHGSRGGSGKIINNANYGTVHNGRANAKINGIAGIAARMGSASGRTVMLGNANYGLVDNMNANGPISAIVTFQILVADQASAAGTGWAKPDYLVCANNTNYGTLTSYLGNNDWAKTEFAAFLFTTNTGDDIFTLVPECTLGTVCGNVSATDVYGYSESRIVNKAADYSKVPDIKDVFNFTGTAVSYKSGKNANTTPLIKITDAEGLDLLSAVAHFAYTALYNSQILIVNDIDMTGWSFPEDVTDTAAVWTAPNVFVPIGWGGPRATETGTPNIDSMMTEHSFYSFIDGLGHSVKNWVVDYDKFYTVEDGVEVYHGGNSIGLFVGTRYSVIQNLVLDESCQLNSQEGATNAVRAMVTYGYYTAVVNCKNDASFDVIGYAGGIMGFAWRSAVVNCTNNGDMKATTSVAGIVADTYEISFFVNNRNNGTITGGDTAAGVLGIWLTRAATPRVFNNLNVGTIYTDARTYDEETQQYTYSHRLAGAIVGEVLEEANLYVANNIDLGGVAYGTESPVKDMLYQNGQKTPVTLDLPARDTTPAEIVKMLTVAYQEGIGDAVALRFVTTVDTLAYGAVGFKITCGDECAFASMSTVYSSILGADETYTPDTVGYEASLYFALYTLTDIPADTTFTVEAFVVTANGTVIYGDAKTVVTA